MNAYARGSLVACLGLVITWFGIPAIAAKYSINELAPLPGETEAFPRSINVHGDVVGVSSSSAVVWKNGVPQNLPNLTDAAGARAWGINDSGQISGTGSTASGDNVPVLWTNGAPASLASTNFPTGVGRGINNAGQVVGEIGFGPSPLILWNGRNGSRILDVPQGTTPYFADAINDRGQVAGAAFSSAGIVAILLDSNDGSATTLSSLGGDYSKGFGINNAGQIAGFSTAASSVTNHAAVWSGLAPDDLGVPLGSTSEAVGINDFGKVVGSSGSFNPYNEGLLGPGQAGLATAFLWDSGTAVNLFQASDAALQGWSNLTVAYAINDVGQIVGEGLINGHLHGFLLTPVPEPGTYVLIAVGIGLVGWRIRRGLSVGSGLADCITAPPEVCCLDRGPETSLAPALWISPSCN
jgi:uncharacterized membrane protein